MRSSNGRTSDSESEYLGSNPSLTAFNNNLERSVKIGARPHTKNFGVRVKIPVGGEFIEPSRNHSCLNCYNLHRDGKF